MKSFRVVVRTMSPHCISDSENEQVIKHMEVIEEDSIEVTTVVITLDEQVTLVMYLQPSQGLYRGLFKIVVE